MKHSILFLDLDDTIFQTKRRNDTGIFEATVSEKKPNVSYMTNYQKIFFDMFLQIENLKIIPLTARILEQYKRVTILKNTNITEASLYFGGMILKNMEIDINWDNIVKNKYKNLNLTLNELHNKVNNLIDKSSFKVSILDGFYLSIKNKDPKDKEAMKLLYSEVQKLVNDEYFIHFNNNNIALVPEFIGKKHTAQYFIEKYEPEMTIGMGDSISDLKFMELCDFKIVPSKSQIEKLLFKTDCI